MSDIWNPWHGCHKYSEGCLNCYVYRIDAKAQKKPSEVTLNQSFDLPIECGKNGYKIKSGETLYTCLSSDFFLEDADQWRVQAWSIIRRRPDVNFIIITKRILRFFVNLPSDWGDGYDNVTIMCTCENQKRADERLPFFLSAPIKHRKIVCEPLLEHIDLSEYLDRRIEGVTVGGESGENARICDYDWVLSIRDACISSGTPFFFKQTGAKFKINGKLYSVPRNKQQYQAKKAGININA